MNKDGKILIGERINNHVPYYSIPGGHLDPGETFEECAIREMKEETDLDIIDPRVIDVTNNLETYQKEGLYNISIHLLAKDYSGILKNMEPDKCSEWLWVDPKKLPTPHFDASQMDLECYLKDKFYIK